MLFPSLSINGIDLKKKKKLRLFYFSGWYGVCWSYSIQVMTLKYFLYSQIMQQNAFKALVSNVLCIWNFNFRHAHNVAFQKSDLFFICMLKPLSTEIKVDDLEIKGAKVIHRIWSNHFLITSSEEFLIFFFNLLIVDGVVDALHGVCKATTNPRRLYVQESNRYMHCPAEETLLRIVSSSTGLSIWWSDIFSVLQWLWHTRHQLYRQLNLKPFNSSN